MTRPRPRWFLKKDFIKKLSEFHLRGRLKKEINATFLTLIPKVPNPVDLKAVRPISLVECVYKLLSKILVNRMRKILPSIVSPMQGLIVQNRHILDGVIMANELIDSRKKVRK